MPAQSKAEIQADRNSPTDIVYETPFVFARAVGGIVLVSGAATCTSGFDGTGLVA